MSVAKPIIDSVVQIVLPGIGTLELTRDAYDAALRPIAAPAAAVAATAIEKPPPQLVTAKVLAAQLSLPISCIYEYAKAGRIPCVRAGRHVRFNVATVQAALAATVALTAGRS
jgi:excisionase family DNA binding protein